MASYEEPSCSMKLCEYPLHSNKYSRIEIQLPSKSVPGPYEIALGT